MSNPGGHPPIFKTEKEFCDYVELKIVLFCRDVLGVEYLSHKRESYIVDGKTFGANSPRVDFDIQTNKGRYLIECKNSKQVFSNTVKAISQLLAYSVIAEPQTVNLVLATTSTRGIVQNIISKYELPITVALFENHNLAVWDREFEKKVKSGVIQVEEQYAISK